MRKRAAGMCFGSARTVQSRWSVPIRRQRKPWSMSRGPMRNRRGLRAHAGNPEPTGSKPFGEKENPADGARGVKVVRGWEGCSLLRELPISAPRQRLCQDCDGDDERGASLSPPQPGRPGSDGLRGTNAHRSRSAFPARTAKDAGAYREPGWRRWVLRAGGGLKQLFGRSRQVSVADDQLKSGCPWGTATTGTGHLVASESRSFCQVR
jgi:hypothetical protein